MMQTPTTQNAPAPATPSAPPAPSAPGARVVVVGASTGDGTLAIPRTRAEVEALKDRREELSNQLTSAAGRRRELEKRLPGMDDAARQGILDRMALLDKRILNLESQIDQVGQQLAMVSPAVLATSSEPDKFLASVDPDAVAGISITFTIFVLAPMAIAAARLMWKRATAPARPPAISPEANQRLDRIENAVDAIAIEVERVSEGQRFLTKLFTEGGRDGQPAAALGAGERPAEPIPVAEKVGRAR
jgi:cell division septum initiation protein DivIVA